MSVQSAQYQDYIERGQKLLKTGVSVFGRFLLRPEEEFNASVARQLVDKSKRKNVKLQTELRVFTAGIQFGERGVFASMPLEFIKYHRLADMVVLANEPSTLSVCVKDYDQRCVTVMRMKDSVSASIVIDMVRRYRAAHLEQQANRSRELGSSMRGTQIASVGRTSGISTVGQWTSGAIGPTVGTDQVDLNGSSHRTEARQAPRNGNVAVTETDSPDDNVIRMRQIGATIEQQPTTPDVRAMSGNRSQLNHGPAVHVMPENQSQLNHGPAMRAVYQNQTQLNHGPDVHVMPENQSQLNHGPAVHVMHENQSQLNHGPDVRAVYQNQTQLNHHPAVHVMPENQSQLNHGPAVRAVYQNQTQLNHGPTMLTVYQNDQAQPTNDHGALAARTAATAEHAAFGHNGSEHTGRYDTEGQRSRLRRTPVVGSRHKSVAWVTDAAVDWHQNPRSQGRYHAGNQSVFSSARYSHATLQ